MNNYPIGAINDPRAPYNESLARTAEVEINVELGTIVKVDIICDEDGDYHNDELREAVEIAVKEKFNVDGEDIVMNDLHIWSCALL